MFCVKYLLDVNLISPVFSSLSSTRPKDQDKDKLPRKDKALRNSSPHSSSSCTVGLQSPSNKRQGVWGVMGLPLMGILQVPHHMVPDPPAQGRIPLPLPIVQDLRVRGLIRVTPYRKAPWLGRLLPCRLGLACPLDPPGIVACTT